MRSVGLAIGLVLFSQQLPAPPPTFRTGTRLVQVNVVVHDKRGLPVADLKKEDFTLLERGTPQPIAFFSVDTASAVAAPVAALPSHTFSNVLSVNAGAPTGVTVILIDLINSAIGDQMRARNGLLTFLKTVQAQDRIAIFAMTVHGLALLHDYTSDAAALVERVQSSKPQPSPALDASIANPQLQQELRDAGLDALADAAQVSADFEMSNRIDDSFAALEAIAAHLAGVPGRKSLVWLSSGFPLSIGFDQVPSTSGTAAAGPTRTPQVFTARMNGVVRVLNDAGIAVYPVDARGVFNPAVTDTSLRRSSKWNEMPDISAANANTSTMFVLAERTGGRMAYNTNNLGAALRRAIDDGSVTYTLGYYPTDPAEDGKWRDIKISVARPDSDVRARKGYFVLPPPDRRVDARLTEIRGAVWSPVESTALPLSARVDLTNDPPNTLDVLVHLDAKAVAFRHEGDRWKAELDMAFVQKDAHGVLQGPGGMDNLTIALTDDNYRKVAEQGLTHRYRGARQPSATTLKIVVRDAGTGSVGSVTVPLARIAQP